MSETYRFRSQQSYKKVPLAQWAKDTGLDLDKSPLELAEEIQEQKELLRLRFTSENPVANNDAISNKQEVNNTPINDSTRRPVRRNPLGPYHPRTRKTLRTSPPDIEKFVLYSEADHFFPDIDWKSTRAEVKRMLKDYEESDLEP